MAALDTITLPNGSTYEFNSVMTGASGSAAGTSGKVPAPAAGDDTKYFGGNGTWTHPPVSISSSQWSQIENILS